MRALVLLVASLISGQIARLSPAWLPGVPRSSPGGQEAAVNVEKNSPRARLLLPVLAAPLGLAVDVPRASADWGVRTTLPVEELEPDPDPWVRSLQAKSWANEPWTRQRIYLSAVALRMNIGMFNKRYFVHWTPESYKYDLLDENGFKDAKLAGKLLIDSDMTDPKTNTLVFIYAKPEDQAWVEKNGGVVDTIEMPQSEKDAIEQIRRTPFPPKGWTPPKNAPERLV
eukprot:CAMPEP_0172717078 /NCGR_PEP_ID=MMETSP1074-20121228/70278_1 /TAXON_ID=2916 /ORGANISM="Ceratium fusus, Strain PA161109" /LENGTH=226 /DNA_ID=CAMNT_0013541927 /DNA_START=86 /DNA_END=766 /DNA_ORIENTATION=+